MLKTITCLFAVPLALSLACTAPAPVPNAEAAPASPAPAVVDDGADSVPAPSVEKPATTVPFDESGTRYTWTIIPATNGTYGFAIYDRGQLYIEQVKATGLGGPDGWKMKVDARTEAMAALAKLEKGEVPEGLNIVGK